MKTLFKKLLKKMLPRRLIALIKGMERLISNADNPSVDLNREIVFARDKIIMIENNTQKIARDLLGLFIEDAHRFFLQFKGINRGKEAVVVATGPSLNQYIPIEGAAHIGVNRAFKKENIHLDYLFIQDYPAVVSYIKEANSYKNCVKFYGKLPEQVYDIPEFEFERAGAYKYYTDFVCRQTDFEAGWQKLPSFNKNLEKSLCYGSGSVIFPALSFALYTHPKRIYLVGCDCDNGGYFDGERLSWRIPESFLFFMSSLYRQFKEFAAYEYPDVEIVSINPVGLRGIFKDIFPPPPPPYAVASYLILILLSLFPLLILGRVRLKNGRLSPSRGAFLSRLAGLPL